jgi:hypothetical protein
MTAPKQHTCQYFPLFDSPYLQKSGHLFFMIDNCSYLQNIKTNQFNKKDIHTKEALLCGFQDSNQLL